MLARSLAARRSVTMDGWSADQLKKMQLGGNGRLNGFLKQYGVDKDMDIKEKYNSKAAEVLRRAPCMHMHRTRMRPPSVSSPLRADLPRHAQGRGRGQAVHAPAALVGAPALEGRRKHERERPGLAGHHDLWLAQRVAV